MEFKKISDSEFLFADKPAAEQAAAEYMAALAGMGLSAAANVWRMPDEKNPITNPGRLGIFVSGRAFLWESSVDQNHLARRLVAPEITKTRMGAVLADRIYNAEAHAERAAHEIADRLKLSIERRILIPGRHRDGVINVSGDVEISYYYIPETDESFVWMQPTN
ncbi:MAG: hypothetical protein LBP58_03180 [Azoarcus sp.]|jgi:hypothetical protein|nr:hypothetical protein [Azoarcus sp.]